MEMNQKEKYTESMAKLDELIKLYGYEIGKLEHLKWLEQKYPFLEKEKKVETEIIKEIEPEKEFKKYPEEEKFEDNFWNRDNLEDVF